ncbi:MAG: UDP-N-acetylglucosamine--N-acetylmuramyl-(pentapeptide) pyrophosphoryl-undecaprenol N-acetylglucosamine transferase [Gemmatimonadetes bacterium]|nr:UDP-N-acetylglucosamine--N-acetylmuramyl-(pentapeptide) pyrophosphoryl-undecaprenol N-acetylglucosamine transferase [Gemmatimonadota bacterium]MBI3567297.1 UDP-N-acetylglucosamine--N-acetylmuramyl-(pentapeptide) pyrophosphoryl-undecaprenol N-acetylglucosamine transferase [Gemmatimonadota bacterium]
MNVIVAGGGTGGHLYPGLAIARALVRLDPSIRPHFVGARRGIEADVLPRTEFPHTLLDLHPLYRPKVWRNWRTLRGAFTAWAAMGRIGREVAPSIVVGTGGYASGAALAWAWAHGVPVVQHIGDSHPGIAARLLCRFSVEAYLGFPEATKFLPKGACVYRDTGNPIEPPPDIRPDPAVARAKWGFPAGARVLLVFGGSQGARAINQVVAAWVQQGLPPSLCVIWATGKGQYDAFRQFDRADVRVVPYLSPIADAFAASDLALARGGMMSTSELCAWGVPMVICPLPTAAQDHQTANATTLEAAGAAVHLAQRDLTPARLDALVRSLLDDPARLAALARGARARARPHAAVDIAQHIVRLVAATQGARR